MQKPLKLEPVVTQAIKELLQTAIQEIIMHLADFLSSMLLSIGNPTHKKCFPASQRIPGPLSAEERNRRFADNLCIYCGQGGHFLPVCPVRPPKKPAPQKITAAKTAPKSRSAPLHRTVPAPQSSTPSAAIPAPVLPPIPVAAPPYDAPQMSGSDYELSNSTEPMDVEPILSGETVPAFITEPESSRVVEDISTEPMEIMSIRTTVDLVPNYTAGSVTQGPQGSLGHVVTADQDTCDPAPPTETPGVERGDLEVPTAEAEVPLTMEIAVQTDIVYQSTELSSAAKTIATLQQQVTTLAQAVSGLRRNQMSLQQETQSSQESTPVATMIDSGVRTPLSSREVPPPTGSVDVLLPTIATCEKPITTHGDSDDWDTTDTETDLQPQTARRRQGPPGQRHTYLGALLPEPSMNPAAYLCDSITPRRVPFISKGDSPIPNVKRPPSKSNVVTPVTELLDFSSSDTESVPIRVPPAQEPMFSSTIYTVAADYVSPKVVCASNGTYVRPEDLEAFETALDAQSASLRQGFCHGSRRRRRKKGK